MHVIFSLSEGQAALIKRSLIKIVLSQYAINMYINNITKG